MQINRSLLIKVGVAAAVIIVAFWIFGFVLNIVQALVPVAIVGLLAFFGYRWWQRREGGQILAAETTDEAVETKKSKPKAKNTVVIPDVGEVSAKDADEVQAAEAAVHRLAEMEQDMARKKAEESDKILAQLEERKKRLGM